MNQEQLKKASYDEIMVWVSGEKNFYNSDQTGANAQQAADLALQNNLLLKAILAKLATPTPTEMRIMAKLTKMNEMALQQLTGFNLAANGSPIRELVTSMGLDFEEWQKLRPNCLWLDSKISAEIDEYFESNK